MSLYPGRWAQSRKERAKVVKPPRWKYPSSLFPNFTGGRTSLRDISEGSEIQFNYLHNGDRTAMLWRRGKGWTRSYMGRKGGQQPERRLYMRTLANLTNPSEVRSLLQLVRHDLQTEQITEDLLIFAHRVLPRRYRSLSKITTQTRDLLFAELEGSSQAKYSEFHMSSGERAILRISKDISGLNDALILIDEVEAGLHPYMQQQAMLEFQRIALRNNLQIVVASHSTIVLESVPPEARLFLDRDEETAEVSRVRYTETFSRKPSTGNPGAACREMDVRFSITIRQSRWSYRRSWA